MELPSTRDRSRLEWWAIAGVALIGGVLRFWPPGRLGLTHFDEGIYAFSGTWALGPGGLLALDPMIIPYAPPGFPILVGLAYRILGMSDVAAIGVSQVMGTLTILVVGWLARRCFGPGSGFAAATFAAFSGPHIAFSRMALTDVSFLLAWLVALGTGIRFLERPGVLRALVLGLTVGLAQQFKYNGWLAGGIVIGAALLGPIVSRKERRLKSFAMIFGSGILGIGVAWLVVWPWYRFVEKHGGYSDLLRHQQSYLGGIQDWWPHLQAQTAQSVALAGGPILRWSCLAVAGLTFVLARSPGRQWIRDRFSLLIRGFFSVMCILAPIFFRDTPGSLGLIMAPWLLTWPRPSIRVLGVWWTLLTILTPFYHPYARLWLPFHALNWLLMGFLLSNGGGVNRATRELSETTRRGRDKQRLRSVYYRVTLLAASLIWLSGKSELPGLLDPSDSVRRASSHVATLLSGKDVVVQTLVRPSVSFYLAGRISSFRMAGPEQFPLPASSRHWLLVDSAILRSELGKPGEASAETLLARYRDRWEVVEEFPTTLALPTLLDLDPGAARSGSASRSAPLWLLRPRSLGGR